MVRELSPIQKLRQSGITPEKSLGQNFLIDPNILDVIERMAALNRSDVILEVGPGLGVLTGRLLDRCETVHCIEVDVDLASYLEKEFAGMDGFRLHAEDAVKAELGNLDPPPDKFVSNLPYHVATPLVLNSFEQLPTVKLWCLMLQKEIADRLFAEPGSPDYGGPSVMTQLQAERIEQRHVSGMVFYPRPRVKSSLLVFRRKDNPGFVEDNFAAVKSVVYGAFSHRRKTLVNSLADAAAEGSPDVLARLPEAGRKKAIVGILEHIGLSANIRAQDLTPGQHQQLAEKLLEETHE
jgi:16S rRNA (adenine1518-N6/adenine1519-N6)-dimethyltransferase